MKNAKGAVLEILDEKNVLVEFYENNTNKPLKYSEKTSFEIKLENIELKTPSLK